MSGTAEGLVNVQQNKENSVVMKPIYDFIDAMDRREFLIRNCFIAAPSITDAFAPYHWSGEGALERWASEVEASIANSTITDYHAEIRKLEKIVVDGNYAYVSINLCYHITMNGQPSPVDDVGLFTFALRYETNGWRIASATWAGHVTT